MKGRKPASWMVLNVVILAALALSACGGGLTPVQTDGEAGGALAPEERRGPGLEEGREPEGSGEEVLDEPPVEEAGGEAADPVASKAGEEPGDEREEPVVGPGYEEGYNPLTGLPVDDPGVLEFKPLLVSVSNFPPSARPQCGLFAAAHVWELMIGFGMTRFLPVYYGGYAEVLESFEDNQLAEGGDGHVIGPVRSGRTVYEDVKTLFPGGLLLTAGASTEVLSQLSNRENVYNPDPEDINAAGVDASQLRSLPIAGADPADYASLVFDPAPPAGGTPTEFLRIVYNYYNQVGWEWSPERGTFLRSQDQADGTGELFPAVDCLTGEQLGFENVVVLWAQHRFASKTIIEMELVYVENRTGLLFRDGQVFEIKWSTPGGKLTIHDADGAPIPLKPGQTFFEVVSYESTWNAQDGIVRYHNPPYSGD